LFDLEDSVVLVTGASRGIGRAIALELARGGANVAVHYHTAASAAEEVAGEVRQLGREARVLSADVADRDAVREMVRAAGEWKGRLDGLVTSAGIYRGPLLEEVSFKDWEQPLRTNLGGTFWAIQAAVPWLRRSDRPSIVTVSSVLGSHAAVGGAPYQMSKAAVEQMTRALALELGPEIRINSVAPGFIRTDMNRGGHEDPVFHRTVARATPLGRWGEPEDIAPAVRYLLSREADWVTGLVLGIDGGIPLR
jgi:3-oxoacyl-[acyl-carrier protein] reductase